MFTALFITRIIIFSLYAIGFRDVKFYGAKKTTKVRNFLGKKAVCFAISGVIILGGLGIMGYHAAKGQGAFKYSLEFMGGTSTNVTFNEDYSIKEIDSKVVPVVEKITKDANVQTQKVDGSNAVIIKTRSLDLEERESLITSENISSTVSSEMRSDAVVALLIATACMLLYIWFRFKDVRFATSAVIALLNDVLFVVVFYGVARISVGNTFIACILTRDGYSINSTIVIFDRIREELKVQKRNEDLATLVNRCISETLTRSIYTNFTTFVMVVILFIFGVSSVKEFAAPLMVGIVGGTFSSITITGALWYIMRTKIQKKK